MATAFPLQDIAKAFDITFQKVEQPEHAFLDTVFILNETYVLKGRQRTDAQREQIYRENVLLLAIKDKVPFALPLPLSTKDGHPFLDLADTYWTLARHIPGRVLGKWQSITDATDAETKSVFTALRLLHEKTKNLGLHEHINLTMFTNERRAELVEVRHLVSPHALSRIALAIDRVEQARLKLSPEDLCFVHGDFHHGNVIVNDRGNIIGLIDFDFCRIGHPYEDLGLTVSASMNDYRLPAFIFKEEDFRRLVGWYGISKKDHSQFTEYFLMAALFAVWDFFLHEGIKNRDFFLTYHLSMLSDLCSRFVDSHDSLKASLPAAPKFPVPLPEKTLALAQELKINPKDVKERFVRGSGHGGQKINKTSSCVELSHPPSGVTVRVQEFREQHKNRQRAWKLLIEKIEEKMKGKESKRAQEQFRIRKQKARRGRKAKEKMFVAKKKRGEIKNMRKNIASL